MNTPNCCEKCEKVIPTDSPDGSLMQLTYCSNAACSCHTAKASATPDWEKAVEGHEAKNAFLAGIEMFTHGKSTGFLSGKKFTAQELWDFLVFVHEHFLAQALSDQRRELAGKVEKLRKTDNGMRFASMTHGAEQDGRYMENTELVEAVLEILKD